MSETFYPLMPVNSSQYQFLVQREETFFMDKLSLIADNKPIFHWNVHSLNLKGKKIFTFEGKPLEIHWHWGWSGQPINFNVYYQGTIIAKYSEPTPHGMVEGLSRYILQWLGLPTSNRVANPGMISWSLTAIGLLLGVGIAGAILGWNFFDPLFDFGNFLIVAAIIIVGLTLVGLLIDFARVQWYRFRNKL